MRVFLSPRPLHVSLLLLLVGSVGSAAAAPDWQLVPGRLTTSWGDQVNRTLVGAKPASSKK